MNKYRKTSMTREERSKNRYPGSKIRCITLNDMTIAVPICYELHFPEIVRIMALQRPFLIVKCVANISWRNGSPLPAPVP